jgi:hypothetical protein
MRTAMIAVALVAMAATTAQAKNLCLNVGFDRLVLSKIKIPKKPGDATTLQGSFIINVGTVSAPIDIARPVSGVVTRGTSSGLSVVVNVHGNHSGNEIFSSFSMAWAADDEFLGTAQFDGDNDGTKDDGSAAVTALDCDSITSFP